MGCGLRQRPTRAFRATPREGIFNGATEDEKTVFPLKKGEARSARGLCSAPSDYLHNTPRRLYDCCRLPTAVVFAFSPPLVRGTFREPLVPWARASMKISRPCSRRRTRFFFEDEDDDEDDFQRSFTCCVAVLHFMKTFPLLGGAPEELGCVLLGKPTPSAFATAVALAATPPREGIFTRPPNGSSSAAEEHRRLIEVNEWKT